MSSLFDILSNKKDSRSINWYVKEKQIENLIKSNWDTVLGNLSKYLFFSFYRKGYLYMNTQNFAWVTELDFYKKELIQKFNTILKGKGKVFDIKVKYELNKTETKNKSVEKTPLPFDQKIKALNERKEKDGQKLCSNCHVVLTKDPICTFCRCEKQNI
tara:strand:+ start:1901 stop:2374 length:474 start_codon:yes stop_codon:yes gene_type:complete